MERFADRPKPRGVEMTVSYKTDVTELFAASFLRRYVAQYPVCFFKRRMPVKRYLARELWQYLNKLAKSVYRVRADFGVLAVKVDYLRYGSV